MSGVTSSNAAETYRVGLAAEMKSASLELWEVLKEEDHEARNIHRPLFSRRDSLAILRIAVADTDGLVDEEDVRVRVPRLLEGMRLLSRIGDAAWTEFHEEAHGRGRAGTAVRPEYDIVLTGIVPALEEVEKQMTGLHVDVSRVGSVNHR